MIKMQTKTAKFVIIFTKFDQFDHKSDVAQNSSSTRQQKVQIYKLHFFNNLTLSLESFYIGKKIAMLTGL